MRTGGVYEKTADKPPRATRFVPPTLEEVRAYCREIGSCIDAEHFVDFYTANGWKIGSQPMQDWKAAVRNWEKRQKREFRRDLNWSFADL